MKKSKRSQQWDTEMLSPGRQHQLCAGGSGQLIQLSTPSCRQGSTLELAEHPERRQGLVLARQSLGSVAQVRRSAAQASPLGTRRSKAARAAQQRGTLLSLRGRVAPELAAGLPPGVAGATGMGLPAPGWGQTLLQLAGGGRKGTEKMLLIVSRLLFTWLVGSLPEGLWHWVGLQQIFTVCQELL